jgi:hypothetical protein
VGKHTFRVLKRMKPYADGSHSEDPGRLVRYALKDF